MLRNPSSFHPRRAVAELLVAAATAFLAASATAAQPPRIIALGNPATSAGGGPYAMSANARVIGGWVRDPVTELQIAAGWRVDGDQVEYIAIGDLPGGAEVSTVQGVSADGTVMIGAGEVAAGQEAFRWTEETGIVGLGELPGGAYGSYANGISNDGRVIVGYSISDRGTEATIWTPDGIRGLGFLPGAATVSNAQAVTPDGRVVVGSSTSSLGPQAFRWTEETGMVGLGPPEGSGPGDLRMPQALAVSDDGRIIAGWIPTIFGETAWRWSEDEGYVTLPELPGGDWQSWAWDLNHDGSMVLGYGTAEEGKTALVWDRVHETRSLQDVLRLDYGFEVPGWYLRHAEAISQDGRYVIGSATTPSWGLEGFLLILPPACDDGIDNDGDGRVDVGDDPGCPTASSGPENPACDDGIDNDGDGGIDTGDTNCSAAWPYRESCGLGAELVLLVPAIATLRRRKVVAGVSVNT